MSVGRSARAGCSAALLFAAALLAGCATPLPRPATSAQAGDDQMAGRLAVRVAAMGDRPERSVNVAFDLRGRPEAGQIDLTTPLGSIVAQARWGPGEVLLVTPQGERRFSDLDALSREALGEAIPVAALFDWLRGRPWPGAASRAEAEGFSQLGWRVDLSRQGDGLVLAQRAQPPAVSVRAVLDRP